METQTLPPGNYVIEKRAPSGFFGMRGKKPWNYPQYEYPDELYKRAPMGFVGMRGKKETTDNDNDLSFGKCKFDILYLKKKCCRYHLVNKKTIFLQKS